jgi:hypothetical protein
MGVLPQALEIMFEVQMKRSNKRITRGKKKLFNLQNVCAFFFPSLWTPHTLEPHNFLKYLLFILDDLKCYRSVT